MSKEFKCPSCSSPMIYDGGESIFQTCGNCHAPIIVPSDILYTKSQRIASENFATLAKDVPVDVDEVTNQLTPGDSLPNENEVIDPEARIEKFEIYQEKIVAGSVREKKALDKIVSPGNDLAESSPYDELISTPKAGDPTVEAAIDRIKSELRTGDKIEAIKIYQKAFGRSLKDAKQVIDAIERLELAAPEKQ